MHDRSGSDRRRIWDHRLRVDKGRVARKREGRVGDESDATQGVFRRRDTGGDRCRWMLLNGGTRAEDANTEDSRPHIEGSSSSSPTSFQVGASRLIARTNSTRLARKPAGTDQQQRAIGSLEWKCRCFGRAGCTAHGRPKKRSRVERSSARRGRTGM